MQKKIFFIFSLAFFLTAVAYFPLNAHEKKEEVPEAAVQAVPADKPQVPTTEEITMPTSDDAEAPFTMPPLSEALFAHMHNKLVHLPFGLVIAALLLYLAGIKEPRFAEVARWLVLITALVAIPIYFTGTSQGEAFDETSKEWLVELHEKIGITTAITFWIWAVIGWLKPAQRFAWLWGLIVLAFLAVAGFYGGLVATVRSASLVRVAIRERERESIMTQRKRQCLRKRDPLFGGFLRGLFTR